MSNEITLKRYDRTPALEAVLQQATGAPINLQNATVKFLMKDQDGLKIDSPVTIIDVSRGMVKYDWAEDDTDEVGDYQAEFEITFSNGRKMTVPNDDYIVVVILEDLG